MLDVLCPTCGSLIRIKTESGIGQHISCHNCQDVFTLLSLRPPKLERMYVEWNIPSDDNGRRENKHFRERYQYASSIDDEDDLEDSPNDKRLKKYKKRGNRYKID